MGKFKKQGPEQFHANRGETWDPFRNLKSKLGDLQTKKKDSGGIRAKGKGKSVIWLGRRKL